MKITPAERIVNLRKELSQHSLRYYTLGAPSISDQEYDALMAELRALEKDHPEMASPNSPTVRVGSPIPTGLKKVRHKVRMLSLDNVNNLNEAVAFFKSMTGQEVTIEMKVDGLSMHLCYENGELVQAVTRGSGVEGENVTENVRTIKTVPLLLKKPVNIDVRGEVYWRISKFNAYNETLPENERYANPRNGASGIIRQKYSKDVAPCNLDFVAYAATSDLPAGVTSQEALLDYLEYLGFLSTMTLPPTRDMDGLPYIRCLMEPGELLASINFLDDYRKSLDLDTDGLVIKLSSISGQRDIGEGTTSPKWAAAYKFPPERKSTRFNGVTLQVGKTGQITPVAELDPVALGGVIVRRVNLCNQDELDRLCVDIGDYLWVQRSGEVIPKIVGLARPSPTKRDPNTSYQMPKVCPCCSTMLSRPEGMVNMFCNNADCYDQIFARLSFAIGRDALDVRGCGESAIKILMDKTNVKRLSDLYALTDFSMLKPAMAKNMREGLERAKKLPLWRKLSALSIEGIGKVSCQDLAAKYSSFNEMFSDYEGMVNMIGEVATTAFHQWVDQNISELERLSDFGFKFEEDARTTGPLSGKTFCITGDLVSGRRDNAIALIESKGGTVKGAVTKNVNFLIKGFGGGEKKPAGAVKWGTKIISEEELYQMMGEPMPIPAEREEIER